MRSFKSTKICSRGFVRYNSQTGASDLVTKTNFENYSVLTLNKAKVNSIDGPLLLAIQQQLKEVENDQNMRGVIFTGLPGVYSAGFDLIYLSKFNRDEMRSWFTLFNETLQMMCLTRLISITAISGHAPAGGAVLSLSSDYRIATQGNYKIGLNETQVGIVVPPAVLSLLVDVVGQRNSQLLGLTGKLMSPDEALIWTCR